MTRKLVRKNSRRSTRFRVARFLCAASIVGVAALMISSPANAGIEPGTGAVQDFFNLSSGTINEGGSDSASLQLHVAPGDNSVGGAGSTTRRFNGNTVNFSAPGSTAGGSSSNDGGGNNTAGFNTGALTYNTPGVYTISYNQGFSFHQTENPSYSIFSQGNYDGSNNVSGSVTLTVLNVAPQNVTLSLGSNPINQGTHGSASMTATDPGSDTLTFNVNGHSVTAPQTGAGSTRTSGSVDLGQYNVPGVYTITGSVSDNFGGTTGATSQNLTVLNLPPVIDSLGIFSRTPVPMGASDMIQFVASAHDPGGDSLTYAWNLSGAGGPYTDQVGNNPTSAVQYFIGTHTISVQVSDPYGGTVTQNFVFTVIPEPTSIVLLGLGGVVAGLMFRKRKSC